MNHDVRYDRPGRPWDRYTCFSPECRGDTLLRQPWMSQAHWEESVQTFMDAHMPNKQRPA